MKSHHSFFKPALFKQILVCITLVNSVAFAQDKDYVQRHQPTEPIYASTAFYEKFKAQLPPAPKEGSPEQKKDEEELRRLQKSRTTQDCERAKREVDVSIAAFFGPPDGDLDAATLTAVAAFFAQVRNDADFFILKLKKDLTRPRPYLYMKDIKPCVLKEKTAAYPSGHALLAKLYAAILSEIFPGQKEKFEKRAQQIREDRVLAGVHHSSDIEAGQKLALILHDEFKKSKKYQDEIQKFQKQFKK